MTGVLYKVSFHVLARPVDLLGLFAKLVFFVWTMAETCEIPTTTATNTVVGLMFLDHKRFCIFP